MGIVNTAVGVFSPRLIDSEHRLRDFLDSASEEEEGEEGVEGEEGGEEEEEEEEEEGLQAGDEEKVDEGEVSKGRAGTSTTSSSSAPSKYAVHPPDASPGGKITSGSYASCNTAENSCNTAENSCHTASTAGKSAYGKNNKRGINLTPKITNIGDVFPGVGARGDQEREIIERNTSEVSVR